MKNEYKTLETSGIIQELRDQKEITNEILEKIEKKSQKHFSEYKQIQLIILANKSKCENYDETSRKTELIARDILQPFEKMCISIKYVIVVIIIINYRSIRKSLDAEAARRKCSLIDLLSLQVIEKIPEIDDVNNTEQLLMDVISKDKIFKGMT